MKQYFQGFREPVSGFLHFAGFLLSIAAFILLETYATVSVFEELVKELK